MRKKLLGGLLVVAIAAVAAFNVNMNTDKSELSLLALANVEALAVEWSQNDSRDCGCPESGPDCRGSYCGTYTINGTTMRFYACC